MQPDTPVYCASVTKLYTAAVVMQLWEQERLDLDAVITRYLPAGLVDGIHRLDGVDRSGAITVRHLLSHTSGLPDYFLAAPAGQKRRRRLELAGKMGRGHNIHAARSSTPMMARVHWLGDSMGATSVQVEPPVSNRNPVTPGPPERAMVEPHQDPPVAETFARERTRLWTFIRARVVEPMDAEDILQDVFTELVLANRLARPIEHLGAWLFQVARNRITDRFRKGRREAPLDATAGDGDGPALAERLPSPDAGPEAAYARSVLLAAIEDAVADLPRSLREVFIAHEIERRSFKDIAAETGVGLNTLLSRKRYAVRQLRRRLQSIHDDYTGKDL